MAIPNTIEGGKPEFDNTCRSFRMLGFVTKVIDGYKFRYGPVSYN